VTAIYSADCDCGVCSSLCARQDFATEDAACRAWLDGSARWLRSFANEMPPTARYFAVHGPGGHVIGVVHRTIRP